MTIENEPVTYVEAQAVTLGEMIQHYDAFSDLDLEGLMKRFEAGEDDEV